MTILNAEKKTALAAVCQVLKSVKRKKIKEKIKASSQKDEEQIKCTPTDLVLHPNSILTYTFNRITIENIGTDAEKECKEEITEYVTEKAHLFLYDKISFADGVVLRDLLGLCLRCPTLLEVYQRFYAEEFCKDAFTPSTFVSSKKQVDPDSFFEIKKNIVGETEFFIDYSFNLFFRPTEEDLEYPRYMEKRLSVSGEKVDFMVSGINGMRPRHYANTRLVLNPKGTIGPFYGEQSPFQCHNFNLGDVLHSFFYELSWFGGLSYDEEDENNQTENSGEAVTDTND